MRECTFHFRLYKDGTRKELRTMLLLPKGKQPDIDDCLASFRQLGYNVTLTDAEDLIFESVDPADPFKIDITRIDIKGETEEKPIYEGELRAILKQLRR